MKQKFRLIEKGINDAYTNMAIDESLALAVKKTNVPIIRIGYRWQEPGAISLGINQNTNDVDIDYCNQNKIEIVRRATGGQALFHSPEDFTYCVIMNTEDKFKNFMESYREICSWIMNAFSKLDIETQYDSSSSILAGSKKICGSAQTRVFGPILQHGSIFYSLNLEKMGSIFKVNNEEIKMKAACIKDFGDISQEEVYNAFKESFLKNKDYFVDELSREETERVNELLKNKYQTKEWNFNYAKPVKGSCHVQWKDAVEREVTL